MRGARHAPGDLAAQLVDRLRAQGGRVDDPVGMEDAVLGDVARVSTMPAQERDGLAIGRCARELVAKVQPRGEGGDARAGPPDVGAVLSAQAGIRAVTQDVVGEEIVATHQTCSSPAAAGSMSTTSTDVISSGSPA